MNSTSDPPSAADDPRLLRAVQEYLAELEAGRRPDRRALAARFPDLIEAMAAYLDALDMVHAAAPLLHQTANGGPAPLAGEPLPAEPLGDFRIVREIGRGGMGVVYEAVQLSLGRRVALKVLPFAAALDAKHLQRFRNEAQAAATLSHPNIVPVYAVGAERGVHFYAMQLIEGQNLATLIEELRPREGLDKETRRQGDKERGVSSDSLSPCHLVTLSPSPADTRPVLGARLSTQRSVRSDEFFRTAARLLARAADGIEYAHSLGIVHRDIKPANLLVDDQDGVWITDFGLAQFHADAGLTQTGDLLGTLRYMSPEQAGGQRVLIDHRTDIYALGATLYELLTLRPIFGGVDRQTLLNQILHEEPRPPRSINRAIPAELETIVLKAVSKTPAERYATARDFADDLRRFLEDRPIRARRPSPLEKATKWARRHRAVVASAVAALLLSVAGLSVATVLTARAYDRASQKAREADEQRARAEESFRQAWQAVNQFARIGEEELAGNPHLERLRRRLLEAALTYYQDFIDQRHDDPTIQAELIASRARVETILGELATLMGAGQYGLLHQQSVQDELRLSTGQREALARIERRWYEAFRESFRLAPGDWERRLLGLARDQETEVAKLLEPWQFRRFKQISLQRRGPFAFSEKDVVAALELTAAQKRKVRAIQDEAIRAGPRFGPPGVRRPSPGGDGRSAREKLFDLLTPRQRQKWEELTGEPFTGEIRFGPPRFSRP